MSQPKRDPLLDCLEFGAPYPDIDRSHRSEIQPVGRTLFENVRHLFENKTTDTDAARESPEGE